MENNQIRHLRMSSETLKRRTNENDHYKIIGGKLITKEELNEFRGVSAGNDILVDDNVVSNFEIHYENGNFEVGHFYE